MDRSNVISVLQAAERLGLSRERVQKLVAAGQLPAYQSAGVWWIDAAAVERRRRQEPANGRPLSCAGAWLVLLIASGESETSAWQPLISHGHSRERARRWLEGNTLGDDAPALRNRAERERLDGHVSRFAAILAHNDVRPTGISAASRIGLHGGRHEAEFYAPRSLRPHLLDEHALQPAPDGPVVGRWVPDEVWLAVATRDAAPSAAVLLDLLEHDDPRARREAAAALAR